MLFYKKFLILNILGNCTESICFFFTMTEVALVSAIGELIGQDHRHRQEQKERESHELRNPPR